MPCKAKDLRICGGSGLFYSGATLHTLLQIREIAKNQGNDLVTLLSKWGIRQRSMLLQRPLLDVVENEKLILKYAKANKGDSMCFST